MELGQQPATAPRSAKASRLRVRAAASRSAKGPIASLLPEFEAACALAARCGLSGNQMVLSASRAVARTSGLDPLQLLGMPGLPGGDVHFSVTELGRHLKLSAREVNLELAELGLQARVESTWVPTSEGRPHAVIVDVGKNHSDGAPVTQIRWKLSVLSVLDPGDLLASACA